MDDKRKGGRQRVLKGGKIVFAGGSFTVDCTNIIAEYSANDSLSHWSR